MEKNADYVSIRDGDKLIQIAQPFDVFGNKITLDKSGKPNLYTQIEDNKFDAYGNVIKGFVNRPVLFDPTGIPYTTYPNGKIVLDIFGNRMIPSVLFDVQRNQSVPQDKEGRIKVYTSAGRRFKLDKNMHSIESTVKIACIPQLKNKDPKKFSYGHPMSKSYNFYNKSLADIATKNEIVKYVQDKVDSMGEISDDDEYIEYMKYTIADREAFDKPRAEELGCLREYDGKSMESLLTIVKAERCEREWDALKEQFSDLDKKYGNMDQQTRYLLLSVVRIKKLIKYTVRKLKTIKNLIEKDIITKEETDKINGFFAQAEHVANIVFQDKSIRELIDGDEYLCNMLNTDASNLYEYYKEIKVSKNSALLQKSDNHKEYRDEVNEFRKKNSEIGKFSDNCYAPITLSNNPKTHTKMPGETPEQLKNTEKAIIVGELVREALAISGYNVKDFHDSEETIKKKTVALLLKCENYLTIGAFTKEEIIFLEKNNPLLKQVLFTRTYTNSKLKNEQEWQDHLKKESREFDFDNYKAKVVDINLSKDYATMEFTLKEEDTKSKNKEKKPPFRMIVRPNPMTHQRFFLQQGFNVKGFGGCCGLASSAQMIQQLREYHNNEVNEDDTLDVADAMGLLDKEIKYFPERDDHGRVIFENGRPKPSKLIDYNEQGGSTYLTRVSVAKAYNIETKIIGEDMGNKSIDEWLEEMAVELDKGHSVLADVNSGFFNNGNNESLRQAPGTMLKVDHSINVVASCRDQNGKLLGFLVKDTGSTRKDKLKDKKLNVELGRYDFVSLQDMKIGVSGNTQNPVKGFHAIICGESNKQKWDVIKEPQPVNQQNNGYTNAPGQPGYMPPQPNYMPPQPNYMPPQPNYMPPQPNYMPPQPGYAPQSQTTQPYLSPITSNSQPLRGGNNFQPNPVGNYNYGNVVPQNYI